MAEAGLVVLEVTVLESVVLILRFTCWGRTLVCATAHGGEERTSANSLPHPKGILTDLLLVDGRD
jgi:hypothetical protein